MTVPVALHSAQHLVLLVLGFDHSSRYQCGVPHFNWHFPNNLYCGTPFHMLVHGVHIFLSDLSVKVFGPFFNQLVCFLLVEF